MGMIGMYLNYIRSGIVNPKNWFVRIGFGNFFCFFTLIPQAINNFLGIFLMNAEHIFDIINSQLIANAI